MGRGVRGVRGVQTQTQRAAPGNAKWAAPVRARARVPSEGDRAVGSDRGAPSWRAARSRMHARTPRTHAYARPARARLPRATPPPVAVCALYVRASTHTANSRLGPSRRPPSSSLPLAGKHASTGAHLTRDAPPAAVPSLLSVLSTRAPPRTQPTLSLAHLSRPVSSSSSSRPRPRHCRHRVCFPRRACPVSL